jgi:subtilisin-like proprotein convertase family protein
VATGSVALTPGSYYLWIDNYPTPSCISYTLAITGGGGPRPGDNCANALPLTVPGSVDGNTCTFANDYDAVCDYASSAPDVVYSYTPAVDQSVTFSLCQGTTNYDTKLYVFAGTCSGTPIACNDDACANPPLFNSAWISRLDCVPLTAGTTYFIVVDGYNTGCGNYTLATTVCQQYPTPPNDNCANAAPIVVNGDQICATTNGATLDCPLLTIPEVWYTFTTTECMDLAVSYCGTAASGTLNAVLFNGSCCGTMVGYSSYEYATCTDGLITLHFDHVAAGSYWLPVGFAPAGDFCVRVTGTPCPPPFQCHCQDQMDGRYCNLVGGPINDVSTVDYIVNVPIQYHITDVNVCLDLVHTYDGDLTLTLVSPTGTQVVLAQNLGADGDNYTCTTFDDQATTPIATGVAPFTGSFIPANALAAFNGQNAVGDWHLVINDCCAGDFGTLNWFCVTIQWDQILAVNLRSFDAVTGDNEVTLNWATASETNSDHFEILRNGTMVGRVNSTNNATGSNYRFVDANLSNGTTYNYSLVAVDVNGARKELGTTSAVPSINAATITEYALHQNFPNPFNPTTSIAIDLVDAGNVSLKVYNLMGQEVGSLLSGNMTSGRHIVNFDATNLSSGLYVYRLSVNGFVAEKKMLLMK